MTELSKRIITAIIGIIILGIALYFGGIFLNLLFFIISSIVVVELYNAFLKLNIKLQILQIFISTLFLYLLLWLRVDVSFSILLMVSIGLLKTIFDDSTNLTDFSYSLFAFIYGSYLISLILKLQRTPYIYLIFIIAFSTDTFAYLVGMNFGKHRLIERISPKKSVEGAIGGVLGALLVSLIYFKYTSIDIDIYSILFVIISSIVGQIGDLAASKIKRLAGVKDYSNILPGHGGMLDRFDSTIMITPLVYGLFYINSLF